MKKAIYIATVFSHLKFFHIPFMEMLHSNGYEVWAAGGICDTKLDLKSKEELESYGIRCIDVPFSRNPYSILNIKAYKILRHIFEQEYFDIIHFHTPVAAFIGRFAVRKIEQGTIFYTVHGFHFYKGAPLKNWIIYYTAEKLARKWTDKIIVMNDEDYKNAQRIGFVPKKNLFFVHGVGINIKDFNLNLSDESKNKILFELNIPKNAIIFTCVGEINKNKNQRWLINIWQDVLKRRKNAYLILIGNGPLRQKLEKEVKSRGLKNIKFLGYREDVPLLLNASDVLISSSKREGLPKNIMEAMASKKAVIATNIRGSKMLVKNNENGFIVDVNDSVSLLQSIIKLIDDVELRHKMGENGFKKIQDFEIGKVLKEIKNIYGL